MKLNILKKLGLSEKKWGLCLALAGFAALNTGFSSQETAMESAKVAAVEEVDALPTQTLSVANLNDTKFETANEYVNSIENNMPANIEIPAHENSIQPLYYDDGLDYVEAISMEATAYLPTDGSVEGITATGIPATYGIAAVDPDVIPLGTRLYIPGYGEALAADTGGAIIGYRIDLCMESYDACMEFGRRNVTVYILR